MKISVTLPLTCFIFLLSSIFFPPTIGAVEVSAEKHSYPLGVGGDIVRVYVWDYDGLYPQIRMLDRKKTKEIVCKVSVQQSVKTKGDFRPIDFSLPTGTSTVEFAVYAAVNRPPKCNIPTVAIPIATTSFPAENQPTSPQNPEGVSITPSQGSGTTQGIPPFSLPKDPTRFAGMKILDLFNPIGAGAGLLQMILGVALAVSFLFFALGAVRYMLSSGDAKKAEEARNHITMAVVGLAIVVVAFFLVQILGRVFGTGITK